MNPRVLTLIKNPESIVREDLEILNSSIKEFPYIQNIRALHLLGINQFSPELYQQELSKTAAYTTDKKILYHLINKKQISEVQNSTVSTEVLENTSEINRKDDQPIPAEFVPAKPVEIDGVVNRILYEGEENFWETDHQTIDLESTIESGKLVINKKSTPIDNPSEEKIENRILETEEAETFSAETIIPEEKVAKKENAINDSAQNSFQEIPEFITEEKPENSHENIFKEVPDSEPFSAETIIQEEEIIHADKIVENSSQVSFHASQNFLPEVKINPANLSKEIKEAPKKPSNKHEEEMQRLIAEVEEKMKSLKKDREKEPEIIQNNDINFSEMQEIEPGTETKEKEIIPAKEIEKAELIGEKEEIKSDWKPMNFLGNTPDALIHKKIEPTNTIIPQNPDTEKMEERPALNVSFFKTEISNEESQKKENPPAVHSEIIAEPKNLEISNFPKFLDTWQNWLKIDRKTDEKQEIQAHSDTEVKNTIIEKFIQKEPRISKLKEESDFVVKERDGNISHLMTETLAKLYIEQKLYSKAIKGYEILREKHPERKDYFSDLIQKTKDLRKNS